MNKKLVLILTFVLVIAISAVTVFAITFSPAEKTVAEVAPEIEETTENAEGEGLSGTTCDPERDYTYLRGTMYKNLYETKYGC